MKTYDAIIIGAGHNGLTNAAYLAKAGLDVVVLEKNDYIGGAAVSRELHKGWVYLNASYVCSLLRQALHRDLNLSKHGLLLVPYLSTVTFGEVGQTLVAYTNSEAAYLELKRHSPHDADSMHRFHADLARYAQFIRKTLLRTPADPTSFRPRDIRELLFLGRKFWALGEREMWDEVYTAGADYSIQPFGEVATNMTRLEAGFIMPAMEFNEALKTVHFEHDQTPFELNLGWLVDFNKPHFDGRSTLLEEKKRGPRYTLTRLDIEGNKPAVDAYLYSNQRCSQIVGYVTSAMWSPAVKANIALAMVETKYLTGEIWAEVYYEKELRQYSKAANCTVQKKPFWAPARARATPPLDY